MRRFFADPDIARYEIGLLERDIEPGFVGKFKGEHFLLAPRLRRHTHELEKAADAVFKVHNEIAFIQLAEVDLCAMPREFLGALKPAPTMCGEAPEQFPTRKHDKIPVGKREAGRERALGEFNA